ncbi:blue copper protein-like protein, partial [Tanacetum coccineum]
IASLATSISATNFIVGDAYGWTLHFNYQSWAKGKEFVVGDKLVPVINGSSLGSGYDVITLATPGRKWYICDVGNHCKSGGMKLVIDVLPQWTLAPSPSLPIIPIIFAPAPVPSPSSAAVPSPSPSGKLFMVGGDSGWTLKFDYQAWAAGKEFVVGDALVFKYPMGYHDVYKVNGTAFQQCTVPDIREGLTSGYDVVPLSTPGRKWYICGVGYHCKSGMKLVIDVLPQSSSSPSPSPWSSYKAARRLGGLMA